MSTVVPAADVRAHAEQRFLAPFRGRSSSSPPIWLMRQAGRYLPEYREVRARAGSFLDLCYTPALAAEVTLQPIRRFGFDAAILFSDILVVPDALGQRLEFLEGEGPKLDPIRSRGEIGRLDREGVNRKLAPVLETVARLKQDLPRETALIGFCGAPWTVATYMVEGGSSQGHAETRAWAYRDAAGFSALIDLLTDVSIEYLDGQVKAGAGVLQIFDSWAGVLPDDQFARWVLAPTARIVRALKARHPDVPVIGFPRGAGSNAMRYVMQTGVDGISCDTATTLPAMAALARESRRVVQGNLDPLLLVVGGDALAQRVDEILKTLQSVPFIFNLGHGIVPETPPENVARLVGLVRSAGSGS